MDEIDTLREHLRALEQDGSEHARALREGLDRLSKHLAKLQKERDDLHARRESLETQVMDMIGELGELEAGESAWDNVLCLFSEDFDDDPTPTGGEAA